MKFKYQKLYNTIDNYNTTLTTIIYEDDILLHILILNMLRLKKLINLYINFYSEKNDKLYKIIYQNILHRFLGGE